MREACNISQVDVDKIYEEPIDSSSNLSVRRFEEIDRAVTGVSAKEINDLRVKYGVTPNFIPDSEAEAFFSTPATEKILIKKISKNYITNSSTRQSLS